MNTPYQMTLSEEDFQLLLWMRDRGYDAGLIDNAREEVEREDGGVTLFWSEYALWQVTEMYEEDPGAFLTCCGSETLRDACHKLLGEVV